MFKVKYVDSIMMLVRLDLNLIVSLFQHKCEVSETVSTTTLPDNNHYKLVRSCYHCQSPRTASLPLSFVLSYVAARTL